VQIASGSLYCVGHFRDVVSSHYLTYLDPMSKRFGGITSEINCILMPMYFLFFCILVLSSLHNTLFSLNIAPCCFG
jgi:hypothetical protein